MECNKDEAAKSKEIAEKKFQEKDIMSARKLALKAQRLNPSLDGIPDLLATLNIYVSSEKKINGEVDWYGVLGVEPSSDEDTVKKQYRKLALTLHPDKNKSVGAEGAFKILSEAWSVLSDKVRRGAYDQKRNLRGIYTKVTPSGSSKPVGRNGVQPNGNNGNFCNKTTNYPNPHLTPFARPQSKTFWTMCMGCKMQFEYALLYLNKKLECYNCKESYVAKPIPPPQLNPQASYAARVPQHFSSNPTGPAGNPVSPGVQTVNGIQVPYETTNRKHEDARVSATMEDTMKGRTNATLKRANGAETNVASRGEKPKRRRRTNEQIMNDNRVEKSSQFPRGSETTAFGNSNGFHSPIGEIEKISIRPKWTRELSLLETRNMLMAKAKSEICKKLNEWNDTQSTREASKMKAGLKESRKAKERVSINNVAKADANGADNLGSKPADQNLESETEPSDSILSMSVPDPDFHDFDKDRTVSAFGNNEVWAAYDDDDGMPRYYAMIQTVISRKPFKMRMSWLNSKSNAEFAPLNWIDCGFYKTSGNFRVGQYKINQLINSFSHRVKWVKEKGVIQIYPHKGDVWALYQNWSPEWNENTPDDVIHQYDMVEVLDEFDEEKGITVIPLVKVAGFKTVFRQHDDKKQARVIKKEEMFRFSHQVPSYLLTGQESSSAPKGCLELDPAATPMELLKVIPEDMKKNDTENLQKCQQSTST